VLEQGTRWPGEAGRLLRGLTELARSADAEQEALFLDALIELLSRRHH